MNCKRPSHGRDDDSSVGRRAPVADECARREPKSSEKPFEISQQEAWEEYERVNVNKSGGSTETAWRRGQGSRGADGDWFGLTSLSSRDRNSLRIGEAFDLL